MNIAILGSTSLIAGDLIHHLIKDDIHKLFLFGRATSNKKQTKVIPLRPYSEFEKFDYDIVLNFVGAGDPSRIIEMDKSIMKITKEYDDLAINYIKKNINCKYFFISSGSVYNFDFKVPVNETSLTSVDINSINNNNYYGLAKLTSELTHRLLYELPIIDIRIFNYVSRNQSLKMRFFISDIVNALLNNSVLECSPLKFYRDYITSIDFYSLINVLINANVTNVSLDCYTKKPISNIELLEKLHSRFNLDYKFKSDKSALNATGLKINYFSQNKKAQSYGYKPRYTSLDGIETEISAILLKQ